MQLYGVLVLMVTLSTAYGLRCYACEDSQNCQAVDCPANADRCSTLTLNGITTKGCFISTGCIGLIKCCEGDLCNGAITTGSSVLLLLLSSAIITVFL
uniref:three-finger toxin MALT0070C-like n=1 Tax=Scatophagus argus TaxID=75038 RepID=UPI001ED801B5|nr:three-finger toxin MALT0070C-like [Scatophagus argus]